MKKQILILLISVTVIFLSYAFLSCGFDSRLGLNFTCPASLSVMFQPSSKVINQKENSINFGTYVIYSMSVLTSPDSGSSWQSKLMAYNLKNREQEELWSDTQPGYFRIVGNKILFSNPLLSTISWSTIDLKGNEASVDWLPNLVESSDGTQQVLVTPQNNNPNDLSCSKDYLRIQIKQTNGTTTDKNFSWKDYGLNQLCPENYYISNDGKYFYVIGDSVGGGSIDTLMKYSIVEDKMAKADFLPKDSWLGFWKLDVDNGWMSGISNGYNLGVDHHVFKINLISGEMVDLISPDSLLLLDKVFVSPDGNYWSPVFSELVDGVSTNCVQVLAVGEKITNNNSQCLTDGKLIDWIDDTLIVNSDSGLVIYDLNQKEIVSLADFIPESQLQIEYIGTIKID